MFTKNQPKSKGQKRAARSKAARRSNGSVELEPLEGRRFLTGSPSGIDFSSGFAGEGTLALNGSAKLNGSRLELTDAGKNEAGSAWSKVAEDITRFNTQFTFQLANPADADGLTFTVQSVGTTALGIEGGGLGSKGLDSSVSLKFDMFDNFGEGNDSTGLFTDGADPTSVGSKDLTGTGIDLHSAHPFLAALSYDGSDLKVTITDTLLHTSATQSYHVDIPAVIGSDSGFVGFTAGTGFLTTTADILNWTYAPVPAAPTGLTAVSGDGSASLTWDATPGATGYNVYRGTTAGGEDSTPINASPITGTSFTDTGLTNGQSYFYKVTAVDLGTEGAGSNEASATPSPRVDGLTAIAAPIAAVEGVSFTGPVATFSDSNSSAVAGDFTATITWDDGTTSAATIASDPSGGFEVDGTHIFAHAGDKPVDVSITAPGGSAVTTGDAHVANAALSAVTESPTAVEGTPFDGPLLKFTDANSQASAGDFVAGVTWDDGTHSYAAITEASDGGFVVSDQHVFAHAGIKPVGITVLGAGGGAVSMFVDVAVDNAAVTATAQAGPAVIQNVPFSGEVADFSDANTAASADDFTASITWGDGTSTAAQVVAKGGGTFGVVGSHKWSKPGTFPVGVTIDGKGGAHATTQSAATVSALVGSGQGGGSGHHHPGGGTGGGRQPQGVYLQFGGIQRLVAA